MAAQERIGVESTGFEPTPEIIDPHSIGIVTATSYSNWYPGEAHGDTSPDKIRGDLALELLEEAQKDRYQITLIDGGSSGLFRDEVLMLGIKIENEKERGMSNGRIQGFESISKKDGIKAIVWTEPEKISVIKDLLPEVTRPIFDGSADVVIPKRDEDAFGTYPDYQAKYEKRANEIWNRMVKKMLDLPEESPDFDVWFGPRIFRNTPEVLEVFSTKYGVDTEDRDIAKVIDPGTYSNATFIPVARALDQGLRVVSVPVDYRHPEKQTANEVNNEDFEAKRRTQLKNITNATFQAMLSWHPEKSRADSLFELQ